MKQRLSIGMSPKLRLAALKSLIVLLPCYAVAWWTEQVVYVVPTLAAMAFFAGALDTSDLARRRVDEEDGHETGLKPDETIAPDLYQDVLPDAASAPH